MSLTAQDPGEPAPTDEDLFRAHVDGDPRAFAALFARYRGRVLHYAVRMLGRRELAEEVSATVFVRVLEGRYAPTGRFRSYLFSVAHRACLERLRKRRTASRYVPWLKVAEPTRTPEEVAVFGDRKQLVDAAMDTLPEAHRTILLLYYGQELSSREVAEIVGCTDQQIRSKLAYARRKLREAIQEATDGRS